MERVDALTQEVRQLRAAVEPLNGRIDHLADVLDRRTSWWRGVLVVGVVLVVALTGGGLLLELRTRAEIADANRKLCPLVALLIPDPAGRQPGTQYGQELADQARVLYAAYGCPPNRRP